MCVFFINSYSPGFQNPAVFKVFNGRSELFSLQLDSSLLERYLNHPKSDEIFKHALKHGHKYLFFFFFKWVFVCF